MDENVMTKRLSDTQPQEGDVVPHTEMENENLMETEKEKRVIKHTAKGLELFLANTQKARNSKCKQAKMLMETMKELMQSDENANKIRGHLDEINRLCDEAYECQRSMKRFLPENEFEKQTQWLKQKMDKCAAFVQDVQMWLCEIRQTSVENGQIISPPIVGNDNQLSVVNSDDIGPGDSVSNAPESKVKPKSRGSSTSSTSYARIRAEAEKAAIMERVAALTKKHELEAQQEQLKKRQEQLELETELAAAIAKINVLEAMGSKQGSEASDGPDGMNSYLRKGTAQTAHSHEQPQVVRVKTTQEPHVGAHGMQHLPRQDRQTHRKSVVRQQHTPAIVEMPDTVPRQENNNLNNLSEIMEKQNKITEALVKQQNMSSLPSLTIPVFRGDPLEYQFFMRAFEHGIEERTDNHKDRLHFLEQFTSGQPQELVRSCQYMPPGRGYVEAKRLLKKHFGDDYTVATAYLDRAFRWPAIKVEDAEALKCFSLFLNSCLNAMNTVDYLEELDHPANMKAIISKLPYKLKEKWRFKAWDLQDQGGRRARFADLVQFVDKQAQVVSHPVFGSLKDITPTTRGSSSVQQLPRSSRENRSKSGFVTSVTPVIEPTAGGTVLLGPSAAKGTGKLCLFCHGFHKLSSCSQLNKKAHTEKLEFLKKKGVCFGCLEVGHMSKGCSQRLTCQVCLLKHPTTLHITNSEAITTPKDNKEKSITSGLVEIKNKEHGSSDTGAGKSESVLAIVPVKVKNKRNNKTITTYAFLDPGSTDCFCTKALLRQLQLTGRATDILLRTMNKEQVVKTATASDLEICSLDSDEYIGLPDTYMQTEIPVKKENIPREKDLEQWPYLKEVKLPQIDADIGLLIGSNVPKALEPWKVISSKEDGPYAVKTALGWTVNGPFRKTSVSKAGKQIVMAYRISVVKLDELMHQQIEQDFPERRHEERLEMSQDDRMFMESVSKSIKLVDGHYSIGLPLRKRDTEFPNNRCVAEQRTLNLKRKFAKNSRFCEEYKMFMANILEKGFAVKLTPEDQVKTSQSRKIWYIAHHGVYHPKKHKLRVVFDCGASYQGTCLNDHLLQGPDLTNSLVGVLTRLRQKPVAFMADIEGMFHQVRVPEEDSDLLRFLWWPDGDWSKELEEYKMVVHIFGATSSPSCANFALRQCANDNLAEFNSETISTVLRNFYVDDCLKSVESEDEALALAQSLITLCSRGGFRLNKWISNSRALILSIAEEDRAKEVRDLDFDQDILPVERALGVQWCIETDSFEFKIQLQDKPLTRRGILSMVSSIYDPLGMLAPVILPAKQILQELCYLKLGWDEMIPENLNQKWSTWLRNLSLLEDYKVRRCLKPDGLGQLDSAQLHHFADASESGYGTVSYLRMSNKNQQVHCAFLIGKARVAPLKPVTIPRMELTAATVAVRMDRMLQEELEVPLVPSVFWTDSTSVLKYIRNETSRFNTFVANRVATIRSASNVSQWRYVNSSLNSADCASRGVSVPSFLKSVTWISGPEFLQQPETKWPKTPDSDLALTAEDPEVKVLASNVAVVEESGSTVNRMLSGYSDWHRLKRAVAWILRIKATLKLAISKKEGLAGNEKDKHDKHALSVQDLQEAEVAIIQFCQEANFSEEMTALRKGNAVKASSHLHGLSPVLQDGLIRVGGRLNKSAMPSESKHPVILPKNNHVTQLIIRHIHENIGHSGRSHTLSRLRQKFWIPGAISAIRKIISKCVICKRMSALKGKQFMADLPKERLIPDEPPFTNVGVDFFGPFDIKRGRSTVKRYGVVFTCLNIRAVHIEIAHTLNTDSCINAIRRFVSRRGPVKVMRSDNGTNLVRAERELREAIQTLDNSRIQTATLKKGISWLFNPPAASHHGGVWERQIRTIRRILSALLHQQTLDDEGLATLLCEVEAIINDRPITKASNDPMDLEPLTPNHLLLLKTKPSIPPGVFSPDDSYSRRRWRQVQYMAEVFWKRWIKEYLPELQQRHKWTRKTQNFDKGDIVLIIDDTAPRSSWLMGQVTETFPDAMGFVRQVQVRTKTSTLRRPITKLVLLLEAPYGV